MVPRGAISKVGQYYIDSPHYKDEILRALKEFFDKPDLGADRSIHLEEEEEPLFNEWLIYDFRFSDSKGMLEKFYAENPLSIPEYRRIIYKALAENYYGFWEVLEVQSHKGLTLKRLSDGKVFDVSEISATFGLEKDDVFISRVANVIDHYELVACDFKAMKLSQSKDEKLKRNYLENIFPKMKMETPKDALNFYRSYANFR